MEFKKTWTKCVDNLTEVYTPSLQLPPNREEWILCGKSYTYKSLAPTSTTEVLNAWVESSEEPKIVGSFFIRESLEEGLGTYEAVPISLLKSPIVVKRFVEKTYYMLGGDIDPCFDPKNEHKYHVKFGTCAPEEDHDFTWCPDR